MAGFFTLFALSYIVRRDNKMQKLNPHRRGWNKLEDGKKSS
jgi:hypothetical protein